MSEGEFGECPDWYGYLLRPAKYLGVAPWALLERVERGEQCWVHWANTAEGAEAEARDVLAHPERFGGSEEG